MTVLRMLTDHALARADCLVNMLPSSAAAQCRILAEHRPSLCASAAEQDELRVDHHGGFADIQSRG